MTALKDRPPLSLKTVPLHLLQLVQSKHKRTFACTVSYSGGRLWRCCFIKTQGREEGVLTQTLSFCTAETNRTSLGCPSNLVAMLLVWRSREERLALFKVS